MRAAVIKAKVYVTLKPTVLDPQGETIRSALRHLGFQAVESVRAGKYLELVLTESDQDKARRQIEAMCEKLLANPVIESYRYDLESAP